MLLLLRHGGPPSVEAEGSVPPPCHRTLRRPPSLYLHRHTRRSHRLLPRMALQLQAPPPRLRLRPSPSTQEVGPSVRDPRLPPPQCQVGIQPPRSSGRQSPKLPFNWAAKILLLAVLVTANGTHCYKDANPKLLLAIYSCMLYLLIDVVLGFFINAVRLLTGVDLELPSNEPYLSTSLQDFWGRRWNLVVTDTLHQSVYVPLRRAAEPFLGRRWANFPAILATFLVSGLMHELLYYYVIRAYPTWEVTWFFVFHGICVAAEVRIKAAAAARGSRWRIHPAVSGPVAVTFVVVTGSWWFFPPLVRSGVDVRVIEECNAPVKLLWKALEYIGARLNI
ncbi:hypothetical protein SAY87_005068 [Trapa incisa]|uniref:Wax synthase domain-containing protein n=1 Tax=Trapa incisa TaxID=236973 RepID=A0AAN7JQM3_9MYRT|nr:hypothetical protein SAY87_005068 [Trapa incisa]